MAITKCINSESKQYKPVLTDKLVLDAVPTVNSLNGVTSDAVARAIAGASGEVPQVTESDNGKVLTAIYDEGGPAVEWAEAATGSDVTTADGYFRLGGSNPVKVKYTGSVEQIITPESIDVDDHTKYNGVGTAINPQICVWFDNTDGLKDLGSDYTATLKMKAASLLAYFPSGVRVNIVSPAMYCNASYWEYPSGPNMTGTLAITDNDIKEQTITVSGANQAGAASGYGAYIGFSININNATDPVTGNNYDLTDALDTLIADIEAGNVFELVWPTATAGTDMLTSITPIPSNVGQGDKFLKTVQTGASTYEMRWDTVNQLPSSGSYYAGKVLTVSQYGSPTWLAPQVTPAPTAGDGIDITSNEVSVKAGTGLEFDDILTPSGTANLVSQDVIETYSDNYTVYSFAPLTSGLLSQMSSGLDVTLIGEFYATPSNTYAALYTLNSGSEVVNRLVLGNATGVVNPGSVVTFDTNNIKTAESNVTLSQVESNISNYRLGLLTKSGSSWSCAVWNIIDERQVITSATTATCPAMITVQDALCVSNPLPSSAVGDAGKVLTVDAQGAPAWGMLGSVKSIQQVNALPANPDANTLYLIPEA